MWVCSPAIGCNTTSIVDRPSAGSATIQPTHLYSNPQVMAWIMDTHSRHHGYSVPAVATGKPLSIGGTEGRAQATGRGLYVVLREAARQQNLDLSGSRVAIQGFGNVGK